MIKIQENFTKKCPGQTSLFITFNYNQDLVDILRQCEGSIFDKKHKIWEVPVTNLAFLLNSFNNIDDVELNILSSKNDNCNNTINSYSLDLSNFKTKPFDYQQEGIIYGLSGHNKWLLLDAPGLGKTLQILYIAQELKRIKNIKHCLIICGINTLKTNWKKEIEKHSNLDCHILGERISKKGNVRYEGIQERLNDLKNPIKEFFIITNIETLRNKDIIKNILSGPNEFDMIVVDEMHVVKNPTAIQTKNFLKLNKADYMIGATGTVLTNSPLDAYVPLKWIGVEKCSYTNFKYYYCKFGGPFNNELLGYKHLDILKDELDTCSLRRQKDLLNLPPKNIINEFVDMTTKQEIFYQNIVNGVVDQIDKVTINTTSLLGIITRLRQATTCPSILSSEDIPSSKIERCVDLIDQITSNNEKVLVYSTFKEPLNILKNRLNKKYNSLICTGDINDNIISENIDKFQNDDKYKVMLATWSKMGTGVTLTAATNAIFLDCAWTRANNEQAEDRIYRIGSSKPVFIYYLWTNNTIDLRVKELVEDKGLISDYVVDDKVPPQLIQRLKQIILDLK